MTNLSIISCQSRYLIVFSFVCILHHGKVMRFLRGKKFMEFAGCRSKRLLILSSLQGYSCLVLLISFYQALLLSHFFKPLIGNCINILKLKLAKSYKILSSTKIPISDIFHTFTRTVFSVAPHTTFQCTHKRPGGAPGHIIRLPKLDPDVFCCDWLLE